MRSLSPEPAQSHSPPDCTPRERGAIPSALCEKRPEARIDRVIRKDGSGGTVGIVTFGGPAAPHLNVINVTTELFKG